jgi:hypothetical protein
MPLVHGEDIGAAELEREISSWDTVPFARLCNALAWALAWQSAQSIPAFTERVNVADNGIEAEWTGELRGGDLTSSLLLRAGVNVLQYKKREVSERSRAQIVANLVHDLRGAALSVEARTGRQITNYVLFTNVDLTGAHQSQIQSAIAEGLTDDRIDISVVVAGQLASMLNNEPHLRSAFFATSAFRDWGESWTAHINGVSLGAKLGARMASSRLDPDRLKLLSAAVSLGSMAGIATLGSESGHRARNSGLERRRRSEH